MQWEHTTLAIKILRKKPVVVKGIGHAEPYVSEDTEVELGKLSEQGWELVSVMPVDDAGVLGRSPTRWGVAFFKRQKENA